MTDTKTPNPKTSNWWDAFPAPKACVPEITADEVMKMFDDMDIKPGLREFLLVDVRRNDWEVCSFLYFYFYPASSLAWFGWENVRCMKFDKASS